MGHPDCVCSGGRYYAANTKESILLREAEVLILITAHHAANLSWIRIPGGR